jgi:hypothetical protein
MTTPSQLRAIQNHGKTGITIIDKSPHAEINMAGSHKTFSVGTSAVTKALNGSCTIHVLAGAVWINTAAAATTANGIKVTGAIDLHHVGNLSLIGDVSGNSVQIIAWR